MRLPAPALALLLGLAAALPAQAQGVLRLLAQTSAGTIDPHINYTAQFWQIFAPAYDGLVAFRKLPGVPGTEIVPDLAAAIQHPDPLTWRFPIRPGIRFSDGSAVTAADAAASLRRLFRVGSPTGGTFYGAITGAAACLATPADCALPGVTVEGDDVVIRLDQPDPEFLQKLALPHAAVLPGGGPPQDAGTTPIPGTGPWRIASYDPDRSLVLDRNPWFREWSADAQPAAIPDGARYEFGLSAESQVSAVLAGQADWMFDVPPADRLAEIGARAAGRMFLNAAPALMFVPLNTRLAPFDDVRVRRAVAMAVDRRAAVRLLGGAALAEPLCQAVPPGLPGHADYCPYPFDPATARALVQQAGAIGAAVTLVVDDSTQARTLGPWLVEAMRDIGLDARLQTLSAKLQFTYIQNTGNQVQASLTAWYADFPSAANILSGNFGCAAFRPNSDASTNIPGFCDPALDARLQAALLAGDMAGIAAVDRAITDAAPAVILTAPRYIDLVSPRIDGFVYHATFRWLMQRSRLK